MKRMALLCSLGFFALGCGDDGGGDQVDAAQLACPGADTNTNPGFICPTQTLLANNGPADFSCLNTPGDDVATTVDITVTGVISDFQTGNAVADPNVEIFPGVDFGNVLDTTVGDGTGAYEVVIPTGNTRIGYKISAVDYMDTLLLNQYFDPNNLAQTRGVDAVSQTTADLLPAIIGIQRTPGTGILAAAMRDCNGDTVQNAIATVSTTSGTQSDVTGGQTYYFNLGLPANHTVISGTNDDGLFVVLELEPSATAYMQVWGFTADQDPTVDALTLLAELPSPVVGDTVITASVEPLRSN